MAPYLVINPIFVIDEPVFRMNLVLCSKKELPNLLIECKIDSCPFEYSRV
jgi:hypothetical protein